MVEAERTIEDVIRDLDGIVAEALRTGSRLGYFPALYRNVTLAVKMAIEDGLFEDPDRLARLDVLFAGRYLEAFRRQRDGGRPSRSWDVAFRAAGTWPPIVLQHLLAGINAHVNLDLGIAAAEVAPGRAIHGLESDFLRVNQILASQVASVRTALTAIWPRLRWITRLVGTGTEDLVINFSLGKARDEAWELALRLAELSGEERWAQIERRDRWTAKLGRLVVRPGPLLRWKLLTIRTMERGSVPRIIELLRA